MEQNWFEMSSIRRRRLDRSVWVPLRKSDFTSEGNRGSSSFREEGHGVGSVIIPLNERNIGNRLSWSEIGLIHDQSPYADENSYKSTETYSYNGTDPLGLELVLVQHFSGEEETIWHLNQDLVFALGLLKEGDIWLRPDEGYMEAVRLKRNKSGRPILMEIKAELLRDYLCARQMALRTSSYFKREAILQNAEHIDWARENISETDECSRFEGRVSKIHTGGHPFGAEVAVFQVSRNDIDPEEDVPVMGPETNGNTDMKSWRRSFQGDALYRVSGEFWIDEWIEPAACSPRVRWDDEASSCDFIIEPTGEKENAVNLNNEMVGRWLWFKTDVVEAVSKLRGASLEWYTKETGSITPCPGYSIHFGINDEKLITVYAYDIAKLPEWQRRFWFGYNITPDGGVSKELHSAQVTCKVADTIAPEAQLGEIFNFLDNIFEEKWGTPLFRAHQDVDDILLKINRFRSSDRSSLLALAKDIARLIVDRMNVDTLHQISSAQKGEGKGSLKSLERVLALSVGKETARSVMSPIVGVYELRIGDAHLAPSDIEKAMALIPIDPNAHFIDQGYKLIEATVATLVSVGHMINEIEVNPSVSS